MKLNIIFPFLIIFLLVLSGCDSVSDRFLEEVDKRVVSNDYLQNPASSAQKVTFQDNIVVERDGQLEIEVGFFNTLSATSVQVASSDVSTDFGEVSTSDIIECEDVKGYDYTIKIDSPIANVSAYQGVGLLVTIIDEFGIGADELVCPVSVVDLNSGSIIHTEDLIIQFIGELA